MGRNYCFRRKRHSYAACDAALAASLYIKSFNRLYFYLLQHGFVITLLNCKNLVRLKNKEKEKSLLYF